MSDDGEIAASSRGMSAKTAHVVLLCGLPGSGKSSLARLLKESNDESASFDQITHIEYDSVVRELQTASEQEEQAVFTDESLQAWKTSRKVALSTLNKELERHFDSTSNTSSSSILIVMDDNFHLRSMRKQVHQICQSYADHQIFFLNIWLDVSLASCLERNRQRDPLERVPDEVIVNMKLEPPDPAKANWEQGHIHLKVNDTSSIISLDDIKNMSRRVKPPPPPVDPEVLEEERRKTRESQIHTYDGYLRSWVGAVARIRRTDTGKANAARKDILQRLRNQEDTVDSSMLQEWFIAQVCTANSWSEREANELETAIQLSIEQS